MSGWVWFAIGAVIPYLVLAVVVLVGRESNERKRGGTIDLIGAKPRK